MSTMTTLTKWEDQYFTFVKKVEEPVLRYTKQIAEFVAPYVPARPNFMSSVPAASTVIEHGLKLQARVVAERATFVRSMVKAVRPIETKVVSGERPTEAAAKVVSAVKKTVTGKARSAA